LKRARPYKSVTHRFLRSTGEFFDRMLMSIPTKGKHAGRVSGEIQKVLLCRCDSLGDTVLFTAVLSSYRQLFPGARLVLLVTGKVEGIVGECPWVDEVWSLDEKAFRTNPFERIRWFQRLRKEEFDLAVNAVYSASFSYFDCLVGWTNAPRRVAFECLDRDHPRRVPAPFYNEMVPSDVEWMQETHRNELMVRYLGGTPRGDLAPALWIPTEDEVRGRAAIAGISADCYAILAPGSGFPEKRWDPQRFVDVIERIHRETGYHWFVCGTGQENDLCSMVIRELNRRSIPATNLAGKTTTGELASIISGAKIVLGNDSGPMHIAAALGTPAVFILGGGHFGRFFPYSFTSTVTPVVHHLDCFRCYWECIFEEPYCISGVTVHDVTRTVEDVLSKQEQPAK